MFLASTFGGHLTRGTIWEYSVGVLLGVYSSGVLLEGLLLKSTLRMYALGELVLSLRENSV